jgi:hypothetical protein
MVRNIIIFYGEELLAPRPTPKLEDHPLPAVRDCLFNVFAATLHNRRPFLHPQPEDAPCRGDRDPHNTGLKTIGYKNFCVVNMCNGGLCQAETSRLKKFYCKNVCDCILNSILAQFSGVNQQIH